MRRLINSNVTEMLNEVNQYKKTMQDAFYQHYKNIYELTQTNNFRGESANAYKEYLTGVTINYINAFINIVEEVSTTLGKMKSNYISLEASQQGIVDTDVLEDVGGNLTSRNKSFQSLATEIASLNNEASSYVYVKNLNTADIIGTYSSIDSELCKIYDELTTIDTTSLSEANNLMGRIKQLTNQLTNISNDYHEGNKISADKVKKISNEKWYKEERNDKLSVMKKEDPYFYHSNAKYNSEGQLAAGLATDAYISAGYSSLGGESNRSRNNGVISGDLTASVLNGYENAQFTKYAKENASLSLLSLSLAGKAGLSKNYAGIGAKGSVAAVDANGSIVLGTDKFNGYAKVNATALSAGGYANANYKASNGDFDIGLGGKAAVAGASGSLGFSILDVPGTEDSKEYAGGKVKVTNKTSLLGLGVTGKAGISASADIDVSNTKVLDFGEINVNAVHFKLGGSFGVGVDVDLTIPIPTIDMPWED
ncbi:MULTISPECIES: T7SS effector LXG polymorphic toxin [Clostridium]|uniref:T7SS effector LXG polymorphic toxin n=1 Tax=Clostridium frigoriphilum TaxID=443253 RepID=A0ABU7UPE1_9CLOT|nr:T7SS effector LXG polymorphic toxin [Clostridium sp. DSM 17811]MBU3099291.1 LXG domain-containing protein [Clostridium sp. DSM 17811]